MFSFICCGLSSTVKKKDYPRFLSLPSVVDASIAGGADLLMELRVGRSGLGDDWLYKYVPNEGWALIGKYLEVCVLSSKV